MKRADVSIPVAICLATFVLAAPGALRYGLTWDEPTYFRFARLQRAWLGDVFRPGSWRETFSPERVQKVWLQHPEKNGHPPMTEVWQAVVGAPLSAAGMHDTQAFRIAMTLLLGISAALLWILLRREHGPPAALAGVAVYLGVPGIWAHGHLGATETPQNLFWILFALLTPPALQKGGRWLVFWLVASCLSFATKFTNLLIPVWVLGTAGLLGAYRNRRFWLLGLFGFVVGPLSLLVIDPFFWPWQGGWARYVDYFRQVTTRAQWVPLPVFYMGRNWGFRPPWHYRIVMTVAVLPVTTLLLILPGLVLSVRSLFRRIREQVLGSWTQSLGVTALLGAVLVGLLPNSPNHDNVRQFVFVFLGVSFLSASAVDAVARRVRRRSLAWLAVVPAVASFAVSLAAEPWGLAYYSEWLGGIRGAWERGFNTSYWGEAVTADMIEAVRRLEPRDERARVMVTAPKLNYFSDAEDFWDPFLEGGPKGRLAVDLAPAYLQSWIPDWMKAQLGDVLRLTFSVPPDGFLVFYNRSTVTEGFWSILDTLWRRGDLERVAETRVDGLPLARLYRFDRLETLTLPDDPSGRTWYRPASLVERPAGGP